MIPIDPDIIPDIKTFFSRQINVVYTQRDGSSSTVALIGLLALLPLLPIPIILPRVQLVVPCGTPAVPLWYWYDTQQYDYVQVWCIPYDTAAVVECMDYSRSGTNLGSKYDRKYNPSSILNHLSNGYYITVHSGMNIRIPTFFVEKIEK